MRIFFSAALLLLIFSGCSKADLKKHEYTGLRMNTVYRIVFYSNLNEQEARKISDGAFALCAELETNYSSLITNSIIWKINAGAGAEIDPVTYSLLKKALYLSELTSGKYDITVYPLMKLWGFYQQEYRLPATGEIKTVLNQVGYRNIKLSTHSVSLSHGARIDLGGLFKGYAVNRIAEFLQSKGIQSGLVDAGGNLLVFGTKPDRTPWAIGIRNPRKEGDIYKVVNLDPGLSIATSGDYEQFFITNGTRYFHIMDPATGFPVKTRVVSTSVIIPAPDNADGYSSSFFLLGPEQGIPLADKMGLPVFYILETNNTLYTRQSARWRSTDFE